MKKYYIYHIKGIKIGCSVTPKIRVKKQGQYEFEILEEHTDIDTASDREIELQLQYGYTPDCTTYKQSIECGKLGRLNNKNWLLQGKRMVESGLLDVARQRSNEVRRGSKHSEETKMKMRLARLGKPSPKKGKKYKV